MSKLGDAYVAIRADSDPLKSSLSQAERTVKGSMDTMGRAVGTLSRAFISLQGAIGALGLGYLARESLQAADAIGKASDKIGLSTDALQELRHAADLAGVSQSQLDMGMQRFSRRVAEAAAGTGELKKIVEQYGVQLRNTEGQIRSNTAILKDFADIIAQTESEQERLRIAFKMFDSEGAALVNMLKEGGAALDEVRQQARDLGLVLDEDLIRNAEKTNDQLSILTRMLKMEFTRTVVELAPEIQSVAIQMRDWITENKTFLQQKFPEYIEKITKGIGELATEAWDFAGVLKQIVTPAIEQFAEGLGKIGDSLNWVEQDRLKDFKEFMLFLQKAQLALLAGRPDIVVQDYVENLKELLEGWREARRDGSVLRLEISKQFKTFEDLGNWVARSEAAYRGYLDSMKDVTQETKNQEEAVHSLNKTWEDGLLDMAGKWAHDKSEATRAFVDDIKGQTEGADDDEMRRLWAEQAREAEELAEDTADEVDRVWENAIENIQDAWAIGIADMLHDAIGEFDGFFGTVLDMAINTFAEMAAYDLMGVFGLSPSDGIGLFTGGDSGSGLFGAVSSGSSLYNSGSSFFGGGSFFGDWGTIGGSVEAGTGMISGGIPLGSVATGVGAVVAGASMLNSLFADADKPNIGFSADLRSYYYKQGTTSPNVPQSYGQEDFIGNGWMKSEEYDYAIRAIDFGDNKAVQEGMVTYFDSLFSQLDEMSSHSVNKVLNALGKRGQAGLTTDTALKNYGAGFFGRGDMEGLTVEEMASEIMTYWFGGTDFGASMVEPGHMNLFGGVMTADILGIENYKKLQPFLDTEFFEGIADEGESAFDSWLQMLDLFSEVPALIDKVIEGMEDGLTAEEAYKQVESQYTEIAAFVMENLNIALQKAVSGEEGMSLADSFGESLEQQMHQMIVDKSLADLSNTIINQAFDSVGNIQELFAEYLSSDMTMEDLEAAFTENMGDLGGVLDELDPKFQEIIELMKEFGLVTDEVAASLSDADIAARQAQISGVYDAQILEDAMEQLGLIGITFQQLENNLNVFSQASTDQIRAWAEMLGLSVTQYLDYLSIVSDAFNDLQGSMQATADYMRSLQEEIDSLNTAIQLISGIDELIARIQGTDSSLAPVQSAEFFEKRYEQLFTDAMTGDEDAVEAFTRFVEDYLGFFQGYDGNYAERSQKVIDDLEKVKDGISGGATLEDLKKQLEDANDRLYEVSQSTAYTASSLAEELASLLAGGGGGGYTPVDLLKIPMEAVEAVETAGETYLSKNDPGAISDFGSFKMEIVKDNNNNEVIKYIKGGWEYFLDPTNVSKADLYELALHIPFLKEKWAEDYGINWGFASGGDYAGGYMHMVGEEGPELRVSGPGTYFSHADTREMLADAVRDGVSGSDGQPICVYITIGDEQLEPIVTKAAKNSPDFRQVIQNEMRAA